jgi:glutathione S-transferase
MRVLYHHPLCPFSRLIRILLAEKNLRFELKSENYWERREEFCKLNPACEVPVLVEDNGVVIAEVSSIYEYLEELFTGQELLGSNPVEKAEARRIISWFIRKFYNEVTRYVINERVIRFFTGSGQPNSEAVRVAKSNIYYHLDYISFLLNKRKWLASDKIGLADFAAASQLSVLDYFGDVPWEYNLQAKEWYSLIKSRPSFRPLLTDRVGGFIPVMHYTNLDF